MSGLFGEKPKKPEPVRMPLPEDEQSRIAAAEQRRKISSRQGRASTVLSRSRTSGRAGEAGTSSYSNSLLGQAG